MIHGIVSYSQVKKIKARLGYEGPGCWVEGQARGLGADGSCEIIYGWLEGVEQSIKIFTKITTLGQMISISDNPNRHYLPSLFTIKQAVFLHNSNSGFSQNNYVTQATRETNYPLVSYTKEQLSCTTHQRARTTLTTRQATSKRATTTQAQDMKINASVVERKLARASDTMIYPEIQLLVGKLNPIEMDSIRSPLHQPHEHTSLTLTTWALE